MAGWRGLELEGLTLSEPVAGGLRLRPHRPGDAPAVLAGLQAPDAARFLALPDPYTAADAREFVEVAAPRAVAAGERLELAMTVGDDDLAVGGASLRLPAPARAAEIGYTVFPTARGRGLATRATRLLAAWALAHDVDRVELHVAVENLASARTALRAGFRFEAVARQAMGVTAGVVDAAVFARVAGDDGEPVRPWLPPLDDVGDDVLALRPLQPADHAVLTAEVTEPESRRWAVGEPAEDPEASGRHRATHAGLRWLVGPGTRVAAVDRASGAVAGVLELRQAGPPDVLELGYFVVPRFRGRGTTTRALGLLREWAFGPAGMARLELGADVANTASHRVATRAGFTREGTCPGRLRHPDGGFRDEVRFGLVR